jgi:DNA-directed RNA polymerase specialized sigma subunit
VPAMTQHGIGAGNGTLTPAERNVSLRQAYLQLETELATTTSEATRRRITRELDRLGTEVVQANTGLIRRIAGRFENFYSDDDYTAVSSMGFWEAFISWDPAKGPLSHWAWQIAEGRVRRAVAAEEYPGSYDAWCTRPRVRAAREELTLSLGREASVEEIAEHLSMTVAAVHLALAARPISLDVVSNHVELIGPEVYDGEDLLDQVRARTEHLSASQLALLLRTRGEDGTALDGGPIVSVNAASQKLGLNREGGRERLAKALDAFRP